MTAIGLVGLMGAGTSSVASAVAERTGMALDLPTSLARDRSGLYEEVSTSVVDTDDEDVKAIADGVIDAFHHRAQLA